MTWVIPDGINDIAVNNNALAAIENALAQEGDRIVPWLGAGASIRYGCPGWEKFLRQESKGVGLTDAVASHLSRAEYEEAATEVCGRQSPDAFFQAMQRSFGVADFKDKHELGLYRALVDLTASVVVTTNYDHLTERAFKLCDRTGKVHYGAVPPNGFLIGHDARILKLHGDVDGTHRILTSSDYDLAYGKKTATLNFDPDLPLPRLLHKLFTTRSVLFVGCSLSHDRVLDILRYAKSTSPDITHYAVRQCPKTLSGDQLNEELGQENQKYLDRYGITPIWYPAGQYGLIEKLLEALVMRRDHVPPNRYYFDYEKDISAAYRNNSFPPEFPTEQMTTWPTVHRRSLSDNSKPNPVSPNAIGRDRADGEHIIVDARNSVGNHGLPILTFREAGPREHFYFPVSPIQLTVGIVVVGGIAPGINAVIDGIVSRHSLYEKPGADLRENVASPRYKFTCNGYLEGFRGLRRGRCERLTKETNRYANQGGSILGTSREADLVSPYRSDRDPMLVELVRRLRLDAIDILYVIGGDGGMRAAKAISDAAQNTTVVAIPKTMDNDILWVWQSFGFLSAVDRAREVICQLNVEVTSNPRICVVQLFGSDSGFVASHAALASGCCDYVMIPEAPFTMKTVSDHMIDRLIDGQQHGKMPHGIIVMAETSIPNDVEEYIEADYVNLLKEEKLAVHQFLANNRRVFGQTPDELRSAGLRIVSKVLQKRIREDTRLARDDYWQSFRVFTNEPRHLLRAIDPSVSDVLFARRLGTLAVDNAMAGYTGFMVSQWLTEYVMVPLSLVALGRKRVWKGGIFWKSVVANTGQPDPDPNVIPPA